MKRWLFQSLLIALTCAVSPNLALAEALKESEVRLLKDLKYLASDELEGRGVDTEGINKAAEFIRQEFQKAGLNVTSVKGGAFQPFDLPTGTKLGKTNTLTLTSPDGKTVQLKYGDEVVSCSFGGKGKFSGDVVFLGYGIETEKYSDFPKDLDLKGKVVIIMRRTPQQENPHGPFASAHGGVSRHASLSSKLSNAYRKGAAAVLFVNDTTSPKIEAQDLKKQIEKAQSQFKEVQTQFEKSDPTDKAKHAAVSKKVQDAKRYVNTLKERAKTAKPDELMEFGYGGNSRRSSVPVMHIKQSVVEQLLKQSTKLTLAETEAAIDEKLAPKTAVLEGWKAEGVVSIESVSTEVKNVIGVLEGEGPLANETIVIGAHYDHVGMGGVGSLAPGSKEVHNGADDNGSGTVSLLELARRLGGRKEKPSRRIVFIAFTAEERGLIGSNHYVKNPVFPLKDTIAMFNMDMVGRLRDGKLTIFGTGTAKQWKPMLDPLAKTHNLKFVYQPEGLGPSDHAKFYSVKIPVLHFFTNTHRDYHRPTDDWDKINVQGMNQVVDLLEEIVDQTLDNKDRPEYLLVKGTAKIERNSSRPYFGSIPDFGTEAEGYAISGVAPGSPAAKGGMQGGDVIVQLGKQKIGSLDDFDLALRKFKAGDQVDVTVLRKDKKVALKIILDKPR